MLPLHLMSLHEISKREERTMALCVKKPNSSCPWDDQTATTAASPSTSTPPSEGAHGTGTNGSFGRLLRRLCREFNIDLNLNETASEYTTPALQSGGRNGLYSNSGLSLDVPSTSGLCHGWRNGNFAINDRLRYRLCAEARPQQRWLQLRKYWRHNARRRLRKVEREQLVQQHLPADQGSSAEENRTTWHIPAKNNIQKFDASPDHQQSNIRTSPILTALPNRSHDIFCGNRSKDSKELLWRRIWFVKFRCCQSPQHKRVEQQQHHDHILHQTKLRKLEKVGRRQPIQTRNVLQCFNETTEGQSDNVPAESGEITSRSSPNSVADISSGSGRFNGGRTKFHDHQHISIELYIDAKCRNTRRRAICDSMSPIFVARSKEFLTAKTLTSMSERTRPSVCLLQSIALVSHSRNRYVRYLCMSVYRYSVQ